MGSASLQVTLPQPHFLKQQLRQWSFIPIFPAWSWLWLPQWPLSQCDTAGRALWENLSLDNKILDPRKIKSWCHPAARELPVGTDFACEPRTEPPKLCFCCFILSSLPYPEFIKADFLQANAACFGFFSVFPCLNIALNNSS